MAALERTSFTTINIVVDRVAASESSAGRARKPPICYPLRARLLLPKVSSAWHVIHGDSSLFRATRRPRVPITSALFAAALSTAASNAVAASTTIAVATSTPPATTLAASGPTPIAANAATTTAAAANITSPIAATAAGAGRSAPSPTLPTPTQLAH
jgi:hypothetical protein